MLGQISKDKQVGNAREKCKNSTILAAAMHMLSSISFHAPMASDARSNLLKFQLLTMIQYGDTLLLLAAPLPAFLGRIEAVAKMSSSSSLVAWLFNMCVCLRSRLNAMDWDIYIWHFYICLIFGKI